MPKMHFNDRKTFITLKYSHICIIYWRPVIGPPAVDNLDPIKMDQIQSDREKIPIRIWTGSHGKVYVTSLPWIS